MEVIAPVNEAAVAATFLRAELRSPRFRDEIRAGGRGDDPPPELIAVATPTGPMVLAEGHVRLTSYALFPECLPPRLEVLLGISERVNDWWAY